MSLAPQVHSCLPPSGWNAVQQACAPVALDSAVSWVLSAPTGAGKSWVLAQSMLRCCRPGPAAAGEGQGKALYMAPTRALCRQQMDDWCEQFAAIGLRCFVLTGEDSGRTQEAMGAEVIFITPEKLDVISRRWEENRGFFASLGVVLLDEAHLLSERGRGPTLEAVVTRLRFIHAQAAQTHPGPRRLRLAAVSATAPNLEDLARWLGAPVPGGVLRFGDEFRPVALDTHVVAVRSFAKNDFMFEKDLNRAVPGVLQQYSDGKPCLIFCTSRKDAKDLAESLAGTVDALALSEEQRRTRRHVAYQVSGDDALRGCILRGGTAWHTAGLAPGNMRIVEDLFRQGLLGVLTCTTTLAQGVNLPARLVVVKNTRAYRGSGRGMEDIPKSMVLQMIGRAGRVGFDDVGRAVIMTRQGDEHRFQSLVAGLEPVESRLEDNLGEILVNEVVLGSVRSFVDAYKWLESTFLYQVQGKSNADKERLKKMVMVHVKAALEAGCAELTADKRLVATGLGKIVCQQYLRLDTMETFRGNCGEGAWTPAAATQGPDGALGVSAVMNALAGAAEFGGMTLRRDQKRWLNEVNWVTGRFNNKKNQVRVASVPDKVFQLLQALLGRIAPVDTVLRQELATLGSEGARLCNALLTFCTQHQMTALAVPAQVMLRCLRARTWSRAGQLLQIDQVGPKMLAKLALLGVRSLADLVRVANAQYETLANELGKGRVVKALAQARRILANAVVLDVQRKAGRLAVALAHPAKGTDDGVAATGFQVFAVCGEKLLATSYARPGQTLELAIDCDADAAVTVHAVHPALFGLDVEHAGGAPSTSTAVKRAPEPVMPKAAPPTKSRSRNRSRKPSSTRSISAYFTAGAESGAEGGTKGGAVAANTPGHSAKSRPSPTFSPKPKAKPAPARPMQPSGMREVFTAAADAKMAAASTSSAYASMSSTSPAIVAPRSMQAPSQQQVQVAAQVAAAGVDVSDKGFLDAFFF